MKRLAKLLLEINTDFRFCLEAFALSLSIRRRHSGTFASIEGVISGSLKAYPVRSEETRNLIVHLCVRTLKRTYNFIVLQTIRTILA